MTKAIDPMGQSMNKVADAMVNQISDQGVMDKYLANLDANVQDPGLESYLEIRTAAGVRVVGVNGEIDAAVEGTGTQLPKDVRNALITQLGMPISDAQRQGILQTLGWNREVSPHNPVPSP